MCTYLPPVVRDVCHTLYNVTAYIGRAVYDTTPTFALYLLNIYERVGEWIRVARAEIASLANRTFRILGRLIVRGSVEFASLAIRGAAWIYDKVGLGADLIRLGGYRLGSALHSIALATIRGIGWVAQKFGLAALFTGRAIYRVGEAIGTNIASAVTLTLRFVRTNWTHILAHIFAWGAVITCSGIIYGFEAVALPLMIGFGCGLVFGGLTGILTTKIFDPEDDYQGRNTLWDGLNYYLLDRLPSAGVKTVLLSLSVTVLLAASVVYPYAMGALFGVLIGNHATSLIGFGRDLSHLNREQELHQLRIETQTLLERIDRLENHEDN